MISLDRRAGESFVIEDEANGIRYRVSVVQVDDSDSARLGIEVMGPAVAESEQSLAVENDGPIQLRLG